MTREEIELNAYYPLIGNEYTLFYDETLATKITISGQARLVDLVKGLTNE